jgi:hypothetical protein
MYKILQRTIGNDSYFDSKAIERKQTETVELFSNDSTIDTRTCSMC